MSRLTRSDELEEEMRRLVPSVEKLGQMLASVDYLADEGLATSTFLALRPPQPLLLEGEAPGGEKLGPRLGGRDSLADEGLAPSTFLALRLPQPLLLEGEAGVGKTELAKALAQGPDTPPIRAQCDGGTAAAARRSGLAREPPAGLRGHGRLRGAVRVELSTPAAEHPHRGLQGRGSRREGP